jgi:hypothetical protein
MVDTPAKPEVPKQTALLVKDLPFSFLFCSSSFPLAGPLSVPLKPAELHSVGTKRRAWTEVVP